jgi:hypothetical protein
MVMGLLDLALNNLAMILIQNAFFVRCILVWDHAQPTIIIQLFALRRLAGRRRMGRG